ncbi:hypothetical protein pEaSNUABM50_00116 [Erwinia phage pEa_SNUABM_50]|uniref:Nucleotidyltransferase n=2 Tax=Eneladusvirus BF TaxID=2560751 RepID=A0A7L8ZQ11_9CAUD|nr:hypothetical protein pEaSNUABM12_00118 [Erwinia phage pEa_SNUABM_12]QOI72140.1 hypothetical protein pEaSNUABM50_00116 [Erwinia phage pEa_SNUABM_50]QXO11265.1 hypothetical protein pEaSNUABM19_00119 [Erwinia phage pEa_SNUABM_19]
MINKEEVSKAAREIVHHIILDNIYGYFEELGTPNIVVYGSFIEMTSGFDVKPNDIDVTIVLDGELPEPRDKSFYLNFVELPINVEYMSRESFQKELHSFQPKYFMCTATPELSEEIDSVWKNKEIHEVRSGISSVTSKAFDKGRKKLLVEDDYDEVLGLKNIYHAFKFPIYAKWYFYPELAERDYITDIQYLNEIHKGIYEAYNNSTGTLEERCAAVVQFAKPHHLSLMTGFRILFPKKVE